MSIEASYNIGGRGTVVTGTIDKGQIKVGEEVELVGFGKRLKTTVTGVETFNKTMKSAQAGDNVGLLLRGVTRDDVRRGMLMSLPDLITTNRCIEA